MIFLRARKHFQSAMLLGGGLLLLIGVTLWHLDEKKTHEREFIASQMALVLKAKQQALESIFNTLYENLRIISLLPSVRNISGANRASEKEDVVGAGRFTPEGKQTVQQIYNNLRGSVSVSEVYAVLEGLDASKGQVPFFMYDSMVFGHARPAAPLASNADYPEESEAAEYDYFPHQMAAMKQAYPRFTFTQAAQIPAYFSPLMRTCDNAQYLSKSRGNAREAFGMVYSVPFYDAQSERFKGVIAGIVRSNVLEAALVGAPMVPVTSQDFADQKAEGWKMPEASRFVLSNEAYKIQIQDRRSTDLQAQLAQGQDGRNSFHIPLNVHSDSPWVLHYYLPEAMLEDATAESDRRFYILIAVLLLVLTLA
jgi:hypothetical protein